MNDRDLLNSKDHIYLFTEQCVSANLIYRDLGSLLLTIYMVINHKL